MITLRILLVGLSMFAANGQLPENGFVCSTLKCGPLDKLTKPASLKTPNTSSSNNISYGADCDGYTDFKFISNRKMVYVFSVSDIHASDHELIKDWDSIHGYRLSTNNSDVMRIWGSDSGWRLSTNSTERCGVPIRWYISVYDLPFRQDALDFTVCINDGSECKCIYRVDGPEYDCTLRPPRFHVSLKRCSPYNYLVRLPPTHTHSEGLCVVPGWEPNLDIITSPYIRGNLWLSIDVGVAKEKERSNKGQQVYFCRFKPKPDIGVPFTVMWFRVDNHRRLLYLHSSSAIQYNATVFEEKTKLTEDHLRANGITQLGYSIMCAVMAQSDERYHFSDPVYSDVKFCGIQIVSDTLMVLRDEAEAVISLEMTVPFYCPSETCFLDVILFIPNKTDSCEVPKLVSQQSNILPCGARFAVNDVSQVKNISIANMLGEHGLKREFHVMLRTSLMKYHDMFSYYLLEPVQIYSYVNQWKLSGKRYYSHSDPHTKSFDQRYSFESIGAGVFVLYRNTKYNTEVHTLQAPCPNYQPERDHPYCNKAVAIRAGRDVYGIDLSKYITGFVLCDDGVLSKRVRLRNSNEFQIFLPTGTEVHKAKSWFSFLEIDIYPGLYDGNNTEGLCGNFDGNTHNDCIESGNSKVGDKCWRVKDSNGLFDTEYRASLSPWKEEHKMCKCQCDPRECPFKTGTVCSEELKSSCNMDFYKEVFNGMCSKDRRKRDIHRNHEVSLDFNAVQTKAQCSPGRTRRSETKTDEETARRLCAATMNTTCVKMCSSIPGLDIQSYFDNCASDVEASNSMDWTQKHIEGIKNACIEHLRLHKPIPLEVIATTTEIVENDTSAEHDIVPSLTSYDAKILLDKLEDVSCINDCNGQGKCVHGVCKCDPGFISDDCSLNTNSAPEMIGIPDRGLCDLSERLCKQTAVIGRNFVASESLTCKLIPLKFHLDATIDQEHPVTVKATLDTFLQVICPLPAESRRRRSTSVLNTDIFATGYTILISNDEHTYSVGDSIVIFDSTCMECNKDYGQIACIKKPGFCVLYGRCYAQGDTMECYSCQGDSSESLQWTIGSACLSHDDTSRKYWIIGLVLGLVGAIVAVIASLYIRKFVCKKNNITEQAPVVPGPANQTSRPGSSISTRRIQVDMVPGRISLNQDLASDEVI